MRIKLSPFRTTIFAVLGMATAVPAMAMPVSGVVSVPQASSAIQAENVQYRNSNKVRGFHRRGNNYYFNGHRGHRQYRPGWRSHNGWWFPPAAFVLGAIIGSQYDRPSRDYSRAHYRWCDNRYRSYRAWDNSYQPYDGPRRQCYSPY